MGHSSCLFSTNPVAGLIEATIKNYLDFESPSTNIFTFRSGNMSLECDIVLSKFQPTNKSLGALPERDRWVGHFSNTFDNHF